MDSVTEVWQVAWPWIRDGRLTRAQVQQAMENGLRYKPGWAQKTIAALKYVAEQPVRSWQVRMEQLDLASISELGLYDLLLATGGEGVKVATMRKQITNPNEFRLAIEKWECRGWLIVQRSANDRILKIKVTSLMPRISAPVSNPDTPPG